MVTVRPWLEAVEAEASGCEVLLFADAGLPSPVPPLPAGWTLVPDVETLAARCESASGPLAVVCISEGPEERWRAPFERLRQLPGLAAWCVLTPNELTPSVVLAAARGERDALPNRCSQPARALGRAGWEVRGVPCQWQGPQPPPAEGAHALIGLLAPNTLGSWVLWVGRPKARTSGWDPERVSVIVPLGASELSHLSPLLLSLAGVEGSGLEVQLAWTGTEPSPPALTSTLERYAQLGGFSNGGVARGVRNALTASSGRWCALVSPRFRLYPDHFEVLREQLRRSEASWAVGRVFEAFVDAAALDRADAFVKTKRIWPRTEQLLPEQLLRAPGLFPAALFDRERVDTELLVALASGSANQKARAWGQLLGLERPAVAPGPLPTTEVVTASGVEEPGSIPPDILWLVRSGELQAWFEGKQAQVLEELGATHARIGQALGVLKRHPVLRAVKRALDDRRR